LIYINDIYFFSVIIHVNTKEGTMRVNSFISVVLILIFGFISCNKGDKGIGPVSSVTLGEINNESAKKGEEIFSLKCTSCHKMDEKYVGPALKGVTSRRTPEWIMNFILNTSEMLEKDPTAKKLLAEYMTKMVEQGLSEDEARSVLEYMRKTDAEVKK